MPKSVHEERTAHQWKNVTVARVKQWRRHALKMTSLNTLWDLEKVPTKRKGGKTRTHTQGRRNLNLHALQTNKIISLQDGKNRKT